MCRAADNSGLHDFALGLHADGCVWTSWRERAQAAEARSALVESEVAGIRSDLTLAQERHQTELRTLQTRYVEDTGALTAVSEEVDVLKGRLHRALAERDESREETKTHMAGLTDARHRVAELMTQLEQANRHGADVSVLQQRIRELEAHAATTTRTVTDAQHEAERLAQELMRKDERAVMLEAKLREAEDERPAVAEQPAQPRCLTELVRAHLLW